MYTVLTGTRLGLDWSIIILFNVLFSYVLSVKPSISSLDITETVNLNFYGLLRNTWRCVLHWFFFSIVTKRISERTCIWQWVCCCERMLSVTMLSSIDSYHVFWQFILVSRKNLPKGRVIMASVGLEKVSIWGRMREGIAVSYWLLLIDMWLNLKPPTSMVEFVFIKSIY